MTGERKSPQLVMRREDLSELPHFELPPGYQIRHFQTGDEQKWEHIVHLSFGWEKDFRDKIGNHPYFRPERVLFVCCHGTPIASACAWFEPEWGEDCGYLHMVGVHPDHSGKGLGYAVSLAALRQMKEDGRQQAVLETDDFRLPAIKTYLKLHFRPDCRHENHPERWKELSSQLPFHFRGIH